VNNGAAWIKRICCFLFLLCSLPAAGQYAVPNCPPGSDTLQPITGNGQRDSVRRKWMHNIFQQAWNSVQKSPGDTVVDNNVLNTRSEDQFACHAGRVIRHIFTSQYGFDRNFIDTTKRITSFAARAARTLHRNTRDWVIRDKLFIKEGQLLDPFIVADNERFLRTVGYLQDARILVEPVPGAEDSVDLFVITKDLFSIKADIDNAGISNGKLRLREDNFLGMGQQLFGALLYDPRRSPPFGYEAQYSKYNIGGTFIQGTAGFSNTNSTGRLGLEDEEGFFVRFDRPLPSPYFRIAGGLEARYNRSVNVYNRNDSFFNRYAYTSFDAWAGYNLFLDNILQGDSNNRERKFLSIRYLDQHFRELPQAFRDQYNYVYNSKRAVLGQLTFFKQDFIKTQYIYGFGVTEDVPYGYNASITAGWWQQRDLRRPYIGGNLDYYVAKSEGAFAQYYLRTGAFMHSGSIQDASILVGLKYFSKLFFTGNLKIREYVRATYSQLFNRVTYEPLRIDNPFGLREAGTDSLYGVQRASVQTETTIYTNLRLYGFRFAPFIYGDVSALRGEHDPFSETNIYTGIGGGFRTRNESLIFGTIELKLIWFPRVIPGNTSFRITLNSDIRYRYNTRYVQAPDIARLNSDF
jgi:hypothetical protein